MGVGVGEDEGEEVGGLVEEGVEEGGLGHCEGRIGEEGCGGERCLFKGEKKGGVRWGSPFLYVK